MTRLLAAATIALLAACGGAATGAPPTTEAPTAATTAAPAPAEPPAPRPPTSWQELAPTGPLAVAELDLPALYRSKLIRRELARYEPQSEEFIAFAVDAAARCGVSIPGDLTRLAFIVYSNNDDEMFAAFFGDFAPETMSSCLGRALDAEGRAQIGGHDAFDVGDGFWLTVPYPGVGLWGKRTMLARVLDPSTPRAAADGKVATLLATAPEGKLARLAWYLTPAEGNAFVQSVQSSISAPPAGLVAHLDADDDLKLVVTAQMSSTADADGLAGFYRSAMQPAIAALAASEFPFLAESLTFTTDRDRVTLSFALSADELDALGTAIHKEIVPPAAPAGHDYTFGIDEADLPRPAAGGPTP